MVDVQPLAAPRAARRSARGARRARSACRRASGRRRGRGRPRASPRARRSPARSPSRAARRPRAAAASSIRPAASTRVRPGSTTWVTPVRRGLAARSGSGIRSVRGRVMLSTGIHDGERARSEGRRRDLWTIVVRKLDNFRLTFVRERIKFGTTMNARLVTSQHHYMVPKVREVAPPAPVRRSQRPPLTQRERVAASLLACPSTGATSSKRI